MRTDRRRDEHQRAIRAANLSLQMFGDVLARIAAGKFQDARLMLHGVAFEAEQATAHMERAKRLRGTWVRKPAA